jgi:hypothetical protein
MPSGSAKSAKSGVLPAPNVGEYPIDQRCFAVKFHSELMADSAVSAVSADQPRALGNFLGTVGVT